MMKLGLSTPVEEIDEALFKAYQKAGIEAMEISVPYDKYKDLNYADILKFSKKYGIDLWSFHLPFGPFDENDISNPEVSKQSILYLEELIKKASEIGIDKFIVHPSGEPIEQEDRASRMECSKESLFKLAEIAKKCGGYMAVEDLPRTCLGRDSSEINELISVHSDLRVCFDTNHLLGERIEDFINNVGDKIITTHVSDYDFVNERHWLPGEGKVNWQSLIEALNRINYKGTWLYEVSFVCPKTIIRDRLLTCEDFLRNYNELFKGEDLTVISRPVDNLGFSNT